MTRAELKAKELRVTMDEVYKFVSNHAEAQNDCNDMLKCGMDFDKAIILAYMYWN